MTYKYIETKNGLPSGAVYSLEQMQRRYPDYDFNQGPPENYALFEESVPTELPGMYKKIKVNRIYKIPGTEIFTNELEIVDMDPIEKAAVIEQMKRDFYKATGYLSWIFDEQVNRWIPPKQPPDGTLIPDGTKFVWNEAQQEWVQQEI
jgi:hypothetical protein